MARKRMVSPEIWGDPSFNKLSREARLLFVGMFSNADDKGYVRADAGSLKRIVFGFDEVLPKQVQKWIVELSRIMRNLHFYEADGEEFAHFVKWDKYQKQQKDRIQESLYPPCSKCPANAKQPHPEVSEVDKGTGISTELREQDQRPGHPSYKNNLASDFTSKAWEIAATLPTSQTKGGGHE